MASYFIYLVVLTTFWKQAACAPQVVFREQIRPKDEEISFMERYGYLEASEKVSEATYTGQSISEAVLKMQAFAGLPQTGELDADTRKLFVMKRCGVKDLYHKSREKRYVLQQGWNKKDITYNVINGAASMSLGRVQAAAAAALAVWAPHAGLTFRRAGADANLQLAFRVGDHGDGTPFDGPGNVVAHAFPPPHGALHFDDEELWGDNPADADDDVTDFFAVAVHEIGHALGLSHSSVKGSVMYPYYQERMNELHMDDVMGIQALYLNNQSNTIETGTDNPVLSHSSLLPEFTKADVDDDDEEEDEELDDFEIPDLCFANYDTIQVIQGHIYVFEEEWVWKLSNRRVVEEGYPKRFHEVFIGLPKNINTIRTIYEKMNGKIAIFNEKHFYEFNSTFHLKRRGRLSEYSLPRYVHELTTVFLSNYNNKTYLIDSERFWRYDESTRTMDRGYPKSMAAWRDLPFPVDSALIWKGDTYFFHGPRFWRFDNDQIRAHEYYPLPTAPIWFPCEPDRTMLQFTTNEQL